MDDSAESGTSSAARAAAAHASAAPAPARATASPASTAPALRVERLRKEYGSVTALEEVSFSVGRGEIVGLLGPNGAGKTTTINVILGVLEPSAGEVAIDSIDIARERSLALMRANFAAVYASLPGNLTVKQNLRFFGLLYSIDA